MSLDCIGVHFNHVSALLEYRLAARIAERKVLVQL